MAKTSAERKREYRTRNKERLDREWRERQYNDLEWAERRRQIDREYRKKKRAAELAARTEQGSKKGVRKTRIAIVVALLPPFRVGVLYTDGSVQYVYSGTRLPSLEMGLDEIVRVTPRIRTIANHKKRSQTTYIARRAMDFDADEAESLLKAHWRYLYGEDTAQWIPPLFTIDEHQGDPQEQE